MAAQLVLTQVASDNFNRANGTIAGANNWLATSVGSAVISSNTLVSGGAGPSAFGDFRTGETYTSSQYAQVTVATAPAAGEWVGLTVRNQDNANGYLAIWFNNSGALNLTIFKTVAGAFTQLSGTVNFGASFPASTVLTLVAEGSTIRFSDSNGNSQTVIDATYTGGTPGVMLSGVSGALDNWSGGNAATAAVGTASATDNFNRADGNVSVGSGGAWVLMNYPFGTATVEVPIVSNQLSTQNPPVLAHAGDVRVGGSFSVDQWSQVQMGSAALNSTGFVGVTTRNQGSGGTLGNSGYLGTIFNVQNGAFNYRIYRLDSGVSTLLAVSYSTTAASPAAGTAITLVSQGTRHSLRVNGSEILAVTDATYGSGPPGIMMFGNSTADNWSAGNASMSSSSSGGFLRDDQAGFLVTGSAAPEALSGGFLRDATNALVLGTAAPTQLSGGFLRDSAVSLANVDFSVAVAPTMLSGGFLRDANYSLVTIANASAVAPKALSGGFLRDANYALVTQ